jgi:hypothetical protein
LSPAAPLNDNVARILELYDAFNARDRERLLSRYDEDVRILSFAGAVEGGKPREGHVGVQAWYADLVDTFDMIIEPGALLPYRHLVLSIPTVHVRVSVGLESNYEQGIVYDLAHGLIVRSLGYKDVASALVAMAQILEGRDPLAIE